MPFVSGHPYAETQQLSQLTSLIDAFTFKPKCHLTTNVCQIKLYVQQCLTAFVLYNVIAVVDSSHFGATIMISQQLTQVKRRNYHR